MRSKDICNGTFWIFVAWGLPRTLILERLESACLRNEQAITHSGASWNSNLFSFVIFRARLNKGKIYSRDDTSLTDEKWLKRNVDFGILGKASKKYGEVCTQCGKVDQTPVFPNLEVRETRTTDRRLAKRRRSKAGFRFRCIVDRLRD